MDVEVDADMVEEKLEEEEEEEAEEAEEEEEAEQEEEDEENSSDKIYITTLTWQLGKNDVILMLGWHGITHVSWRLSFIYEWLSFYPLTLLTFNDYPSFMKRDNERSAI